MKLRDLLILVRQGQSLSSIRTKQLESVMDQLLEQYDRIEQCAKAGYRALLAQLEQVIGVVQAELDQRVPSLS